MTKRIHTIAALAVALGFTALAPSSSRAQNTGEADPPSLSQLPTTPSIANELSEIETAIQKLTEQTRSTQEGGQDSLQDLLDQLQLYFETDLLRRETELGKLERRVRQLRQQLEQRHAEKNEILAQQLEELVGKERALAARQAVRALGSDRTMMNIVHQLKQLALLILIHRDQHDGALPVDLEDLQGEKKSGFDLLARGNPPDSLKAITDRASLLYFSLSSEILSEIESKFESFATAPLILVPWENRSLVALADGSVLQISVKADDLLEKILETLSTQDGPLEIAIGTDNGPEDRDLPRLLGTLDRLGVHKVKVLGQPTAKNTVTLRIQRAWAVNPNEGVTNFEEGKWYNLYFKEGASPFTPATAANEQARSSLTIHAVKILDTRDGWARITFPANMNEHMSMLAARAKDQGATGKATIDGAAFKAWEESISDWRSQWVNLDNVTRMTEME